MEGEQIAVWFSCGAASTAAALKTKELYGDKNNVRYIYNPVIEEDADNMRFLHDVEKYLGIKIEIASNLVWPNQSAEEVWEKRRFMSGKDGAPCTNELKMESRRQWEDRNSFYGWHVFGFHLGEERRAKNRRADGMKLLTPLIDCGFTKQDCFDLVKSIGIELPRIYTMASRFGTGFPNANCIGCVKADSPTYWNHVRETFPEVFERRAKFSREIGCRLTRVKGKRIFLDELHPDARGRDMKTMKIECGIHCGVPDNRRKDTEQ